MRATFYHPVTVFGRVVAKKQAGVDARSVTSMCDFVHDRMEYGNTDAKYTFVEGLRVDEHTTLAQLAAYEAAHPGSAFYVGIQDEDEYDADGE